MEYQIDDMDEKVTCSPIRKKEKADSINLEFIDFDGLEENEKDENFEIKETDPDLNSLLLKDNRKSELELQTRLLNNSGTLKESLSMLSVKEAVKGEITVDQKYKKILLDSFDDVYPLFYFNNEQRKYLQEKADILNFKKKTLLYSSFDDIGVTDDNSCYILLEGEIHIYNDKQTFIDLITEITFFGYDGPIFGKRISTVIVEKESIIAVISRADFCQLLHPGSQFATFISRNIRYKDKVLDSLNSFRNFVLSNIDKGPMDINRLIKLYKKINPCLHPKCNSTEIDLQAWIYALYRLPRNIFETYIYILVNRAPRLLSLSEELTQTLLPRQKTLARNRDIYKYLDGKVVIVVRDLESDVLDFVCNLCIYIIESAKIRKRISSPLTLKEINDNRENFKETMKVLNSVGVEIGPKEGERLFKVLGNDFANKLTHLCINYQDVSLSIKKTLVTEKDPIEQWTQSLWRVTKQISGCSSWLTEIEDLVVDIFQGSRRMLLNVLSPHIYLHKEEILKWAKDEKIELKTKKFKNENDKLIGYAYYYYAAFPEKEKEKREMNKECGIEIVEKTFGTGVHIIVINVNKLMQKAGQILTHFKINPASKNHIIVHIGYTFGNQSHDIIKPVLMLFGSKLRSMNIIGKCGGMVGKPGDIMVATRHFLDKTHDVVSVNRGIIDIEYLKKETEADVHVGSFLTVAGTIMQNEVLLRYYRSVMGCIGLDMEGYYHVREVENSLKHNLISSGFLMRCLYYVMDVPTDPNQILTKKNTDDCWEEGISSMNTMERYLLQEVMK